MNEKYELGRELFQKGESITKVSKKLGISAAWFGRYLKEQGIDTRANPITHNYNRQFFKNIDSECKAYWLGFLLADGCILENIKNGKPHGMVMEVSQSEVDKHHLEKFCDCIGANRELIKPKKVTYNGKEFKACRMSLCSTDLCRDLINHGMYPNKTYNVFIANKFINSKFTRHLIRGIFDGDGHIIKSRHGVALTSASSKLLVQLQIVFQELGCSQVKIKHEGVPTKELRYYSKHDVELILNYLYSNSTIYLDRKYKQFIARSWRNPSTGEGKIGEG